MNVAPQRTVTFMLRDRTFSFVRRVWQFATPLKDGDEVMIIPSIAGVKFDLFSSQKN